MRVDRGVDGLGLPGGMIVAVDGEILLIEHDEIAAVAADLQIRALVDVAVQRFGGAFAFLDSVDDELEAVVTCGKITEEKYELLPFAEGTCQKSKSI